tara:strand:+ start:1072 stop:1443 length:372 start_codon:yes stop_codon:yes gene_type:complete
MSTLKVTTIQTSAGGAVTLTKQSAAKAYVTFSDDDATFDETFNTSSTTDNGNGDISYALTSNMSNANFPASGECGGDFSAYYTRMNSHAGSTASSIRVRSSNSSTFSLGTSFRLSSIIHGDLA